MSSGNGSFASCERWNFNGSIFSRPASLDYYFWSGLEWNGDSAATAILNSAASKHGSE